MDKDKIKTYLAKARKLVEEGEKILEDDSIHKTTVAGVDFFALDEPDKFEDRFDIRHGVKRLGFTEEQVIEIVDFWSGYLKVYDIEIKYIG